MMPRPKSPIVRSAWIAGVGQMKPVIAAILRVQQMLRHRALCLCRMAFAALACVPLGYFLFAVNNIGADGSYSFYYWLIRRPSSPLGWALFGGLMGFLWHAISRLSSNRGTTASHSIMDNVMASETKPAKKRSAA